MIGIEQTEAYIKGHDEGYIKGYNAHKRELEEKKKTLRSSVLIIDFIENLILEHYGVSRPQLEKRYRGRTVVEPRQIIMYLLNKHTSLSLKEIGRRYGGRDHSTVIHSCETVMNRIDTEEEYREIIKSFKEEISKYISGLREADKK